jgi:hypothetical protein
VAASQYLSGWVFPGVRKETIEWLSLSLGSPGEKVHQQPKERRHLGVGQCFFHVSFHVCRRERDQAGERLLRQPNLFRTSDRI